MSKEGSTPLGQVSKMNPGESAKVTKEMLDKAIADAEVITPNDQFLLTNYISNFQAICNAV